MGKKRIAMHREDEAKWLRVAVMSEYRRQRSYDRVMHDLRPYTSGLPAYDLNSLKAEYAQADPRLSAYRTALHQAAVTLRLTWQREPTQWAVEELHRGAFRLTGGDADEDDAHMVEWATLTRFDDWRRLTLDIAIRPGLARISEQHRDWPGTEPPPILMDDQQQVFVDPGRLPGATIARREMGDEFWERVKDETVTRLAERIDAVRQALEHAPGVRQYNSDHELKMQRDAATLVACLCRVKTKRPDDAERKTIERLAKQIRLDIPWRIPGQKQR